MPIQITNQTLVAAAQSHFGLTFTIEGDKAVLPVGVLLQKVLGVQLEGEPTGVKTSAPVTEAKIRRALSKLRKIPLFSQHSDRELETQVCLALGMSEAEVASRLKIRFSTVLSYKGRVLLGRPPMEVIQSFLNGVPVEEKDPVLWGIQSSQAREKILQILQQHPNGCSTPNIAEKLNKGTEFVRCLLRRLVANGDIVRGGTFYRTLWFLPNHVSEAKEPEASKPKDPKPKAGKLELIDADIKIHQANRILRTTIPANNTGRALVLFALNNPPDKIGEILGLSKESVSAYVRNGRRVFGKAIEEQIRNALAE